MKRIEILYNPYYNIIHFRQELAKEGSDRYEWVEIESDSKLLKFQGTRCIFENCIEEILDIINKYFNTSGELTIEFIGTEEDYEVLKSAVHQSNNYNSKKILCEYSSNYSSSSCVLTEIRKAYKRIKAEFDDYIDNSELDQDDDRAEIGRAVTKFLETTSPEVPVCVIGNYSVGKSALVNALVGLEILPSHSNSTTAKNARIKNGTNYSLGFEYQGAKYIISVNGNQVNDKCDSEIDEKLIEELERGTEALETEEQILHQIIENLNTESSTGSRIAEIKSIVDITVPFKCSNMDLENYSFVFIDTPGSNNSDEAQKIHRENLEKLMDEQTNALPVFVMGRNSLDSNDTNDLRVLLENKKAGFALQNCIIVISMSDQLVEQQLSEQMPEKIKQWMNHPTIMYVSPVAAIGEKKTDKGKWIDQAYKQIYDRKMADMIEVNPPEYNETPCGRKMSDAEKKSLSPLLFASGVPSLEKEINYYACRFSEFLKCTNGRKYLQRALNLADEKLQKAKEQLEKDKKEKVNEQESIRADLKNKINAVPLPAVNTVIHEVKKDFDAVLDDYCKGIEALVRSTWGQYKGKRNAVNSFIREIALHCQKNLYDAHIKQIKKEIEDRFVELTDDYMTKVKKCVTDEYSKISGEAQQEIEMIFSENEDGPLLKDVNVRGFEWIKMEALAALSFFDIRWAQDEFIKGYSNKFREKLKGTHKKQGVFARQCIAEPAEKYSAQIKDWSKRYKKSIDATLNKDNAILSKLDEKIKQMEERIEDMEKRLRNLSDVKLKLEHIIPGKTEV